MTFMSRITLSGVFLVAALSVSACGSSGSSNGGIDSGATLQGDVNTFTASLNVEKKSFFVQIKDFLLSSTFAAVSDVTVAVGDQTTTTDAAGDFTLSNIDTGNQTVTFTQGANSATYSLDGVDVGDTFTLNDVNIDGTEVSTELTGTWTGTIDLGDQLYGLTMVINANGNSLSGTMVVDEDDERGTFSGTENGNVLVDASWESTELGGCMLSGPLTGTFSGDTLEGNAPITANLV